MESIGFGEQSYGTSCPTVEHLKDELTNPDPTVPSLDEMPGGQEWVEENDIPVIEVPE